jgi:glycosyltransferase involved in cell wall biosynthesis
VVTVLLKHLDRERFEPVLLLAAGGGPLRSQVPEDVRVLEIGAVRSRAALPGLVREVRRERPDLLFSTLGHLNLLVRLASRFLPKSTAVVARETNIPSLNLQASPRPGLFRFLYRRLYRGFDRVICQSTDMLEDLAANFSLPRDKCALIPNPVDVERLRILADEGETAFPAGGINVLACGKLMPQKGFDLLLEAVPGLPEEATLTILGEGPLRPGLTQLAEEHKVEHRVRFPGFSDNPYSSMAACDLFVLSSRYEGLPNVVLEALALGAKVAAFDCPGDVREILRDVPGCRLARPEDPRDLARAIMEALADDSGPEQRRRIAVERYDAPTITRRYEEVFQEAARSQV